MSKEIYENRIKLAETKLKGLEKTIDDIKLAYKTSNALKKKEYDANLKRYNSRLKESKAIVESLNKVYKKDIIDIEEKLDKVVAKVIEPKK